MQLPSLEYVGGDLSANNARGLHIPKLRFVEGHFIVSGTGLAELPATLEHIGGNAIISSREPKSLLSALVRAKRDGVLKGAIIIDGIEYGESVKPWWKVW